MCVRVCVCGGGGGSCKHRPRVSAFLVSPLHSAVFLFHVCVGGGGGSVSVSPSLLPPLPDTHTWKRKNVPSGEAKPKMRLLTLLQSAPTRILNCIRMSVASSRFTEHNQTEGLWTRAYGVLACLSPPPSPSTLPPPSTPSLFFCYIKAYTIGDTRFEWILILHNVGSGTHITDSCSCPCLCLYKISR